MSVGPQLTQCWGHTEPSFLPKEGADFPCHGSDLAPMLVLQCLEVFQFPECSLLIVFYRFHSGEGCFSCGVRVPGEFSSCRMVRGDLLSTLPFGVPLLCLDQGVSGSLKELSEPWVDIEVSVNCPASSLENTCMEGVQSDSEVASGSQRITGFPRGKSNSNESASGGRTGSGRRFDLGVSV